MPADDIDDLFRARLAGHATPPAEALWARLATGAEEAPPAETADASPQFPDQLFQRSLSAHATPPGRELWERLEDEHLRPRRRRTGAGWPQALAAAVALLLIAGSAGLWWGWPGRNAPGARVARQTQRADRPARIGPATKPTSTNAPTRRPENARLTLADAAPAAGLPLASRPPTKAVARATRTRTFASTIPPAHRSIRGQAARRAAGSNRPANAAAGQRALVAHGTPPVPIRTTAADERRLSPATGPAVAATPPPALPPTALAIAGSRAGTDDLITVDVRNGDEPADRSARPDDTRRARATAAAPAGNRRLGGRLLQQAGHLMRGERLNLAEVTGLAETVTLRATVAGHRLTKTIQL